MTDIKLIAEGLRFPEGPVVEHDGSILLVEIERQTLSRVRPDGRIEVVAKTGGGPNGLAIGPDGAAYLCNNGGFRWTHEGGLRPIAQAEDYSGGRIERVDLKTGKLEVLYTAGPNGPLKGPNDLVFDAHGGFWFTDLGKARQRDMDRGGVYYAKADGSLIEEAIWPLLTPNGIGLSPDGSTLYVAETQTGRVWAFDIVAPGKIARQPWPSVTGGRLVVGLPGYQLFDSLAIEANGNVCVATLFSACLTSVSPDGKSIEQISMPDIYTTNVCFGGPDMQTAYVTLSSTGKLVSTRWKRPGLKLNYQDLA